MQIEIYSKNSSQVGGGSEGEASLMGWEKSENTKPDNVI